MEPAIAMPSASPDPAPWAGEERLVREAILLVASGVTPRVLVAGLAHGETVRDRCTRFALESGVRLRTWGTSRSDRADVIVESITA
jgi:hypothetical protein